MSKTVYTVIINMPGYLPQDDEPFCTYNRRYAECYAAEKAGEFREDGYRVSGSAKKGWYHATPSEDRGGADYNISIDSLSADEWKAIGNTLPE